MRRISLIAAATAERRVDIARQIFDRLPGRGFREGDSGVDLARYFGFEGVDILRMGEIGVENPVA